MIRLLIAILIIVGLSAGVVMATRSQSSTGFTAVAKDVTTHRISRGPLQMVITELGTLESSDNTEIKNRVRGASTITFVVESGTEVKKGDLLVKLETLAIEEEISERTKFYHLAQSQVARSKADVQRAILAIDEYKEGRFVAELSTLQKDLAIAESQLLNAKNRLNHSEMMSRSQYSSELEVEEKSFSVDQSELNVKLIKTRIDVLRNFSKQEEVVRLQGELDAARATHDADVERALADKKRLERAQTELAACTITAPRDGLVIYPESKGWENAPKVEEGATVNKDQTLLLMPNLAEMQVKVGVHESMIDKMHPGMSAEVTLNKQTVTGNVDSVASVAKPAGWWTGNVVKYDCVVSLPETENLRPGMSAEVKILLADHSDTLLIPASAVVQTLDGYACWTLRADAAERVAVEVGDADDRFLQVVGGIDEGQRVIVDPLANVLAAQDEVSKMIQQTGNL